MKNKKVLIGLLAILLIAAVALTSCSNNTKTEEKVEQKVEEAAEKVEEAVDTAKEEVAEKAEETAAAVGEAVDAAKEEVAEKAEEVAEKAEEAAAAVGEAVDTAKEEVAEKVEEVAEKAEEVVTAAEETVAEAVEEAGEKAEEAVAAVTVMNHEEFVKAELDTAVTIEAYVQANQSWWDGKIKLYMQDENHGGYFVYDMPCSEEEAAKITVPGTKLRISGMKAEWSGEAEIIEAKYEILEGSFIAEPEDVTALFGTDELISHMNEKIAIKDAKVAAKTIEGQEGEFAFLYAWDGSGSHDSNSDLYFDVEIGGQVYTFTVESYLCGNGTDVYKAVEGLKVGDTIDLEGFLYWYNGANPHITSVTVK